MTHVAVYDRMTDLTGWTASAGVAAGTFDYGPKMVLAKSAAGTQVDAVRPFTPPADTFAVDFDLYTPTGANFRVSLLDSSDAVLGYVDCNAGTLTFDTNGASAQTTTYPQAQHRYFCVRVTPTTMRLFRSVGDGQTPASDNYGPIGAALAYTGTVAKVKVESLGSTTGTAYFTNLTVHDLYAVANGDSNTMQRIEWDANPQYPNRRQSTQDYSAGYPYKLGQLLPGTPWVQVRGVGGSSIAESNARFDGDVVQLGTRYVVLLYGSAAILRGDSLATLQSTVTSMVQAAQANGSTVIIGKTPPASGFTSGQNSIKNAYNAWLPTLPGVIVAETHDPLTLNGTGGDAVNPALFLDTVHYNPAGASLVAAAFDAAWPVEAASGHTSDTDAAHGAATLYEPVATFDLAALIDSAYATFDLAAAIEDAGEPPYTLVLGSAGDTTARIGSTEDVTLRIGGA